ncbi:MAG: IPT/TIG domain-containing protein [Acidithiobacillales bacterium]
MSFTIDAPGRFADNGLQTFVARTSGGVASAGAWSLYTGVTHVKASFECASATVEVDFAPCPDCVPFISAVNPDNGSTAGGDVVTISGGHFTDFPLSTVTFGGVPVSPDANPPVTNTSITVHTPPHAAGTVDVCATFFGGNFRSNCVPFTYRGGGGGACNTDGSIFISSISPNTGPASGGTVVTINGGGFPTTTGAAGVAFGGVAAQVTSASATQITATTPQRALANPTVPETVDVTVTDLGSPTQRCARLSGSFTYTPAALTPSIYSISPVTGPNDNPTRVTIFGTGFQFPEQVFMTGGGCGTQKVEASVVSPITLTQIVFDTPRAVGAYSCLAGSQVDVQVLNPSTGKSATCPGCFKFYSCPAASSASPSVIPAGTGAIVTVTGTNFVAPVQATFTAGGVPAFPLNVVSVSATSVLIQMPPLSTITGTAGSCQSIGGTITLQSTSLSCSPVTVPVSYHADTPTITSFSPTTAAQAGGTSITVLGTNFGSAMTAAITKDGSVVGSPVVATVNSSGSLTFATPFIPDSSFNRQSCVAGGTQAIPTTFGIRVTNTQSGCTADISGLVISPTNTACTSALAITTTTLPAAIVCTPYSQTVAVTGGTPPYFNYTATGLPAGLTINATTGLISGIPVLASSGAGGSVPMTVVLTVQDTASASASRSVPILFSDPFGPFTVNGVSPQSVPATGSGPSSAFSVSGGTGTINWSIDGISPPPASGSLTLASGTGATNSFVSSGLAPGTYSVTVRATDSLCAPPHTNTVTVTVNSP